MPRHGNANKTLALPEKEVFALQGGKHITVLSNGKKLVLNANTILYVLMIERTAEIHVSGGKVYETRMKISELEEALGDGFLKVHRGCLVSSMAIHDITDHINLFPEHPLRGKNIEYGPRFPDMSEAYSKELIAKALEIAQEKGIKVQQGVYLGTQGPTFETPSEYKMFHFLFTY